MMLAFGLGFVLGLIAGLLLAGLWAIRKVVRTASAFRRMVM